MIRRSIAIRLALMFACVALIVFLFVGIALSRVLHSELDRHELGELQTKLAFTKQIVGRCMMRAKWAMVESKLDALSTGATRFYVESKDENFAYGEPPPPEMRTLSEDIPGEEERPPLRVTVGIDVSRFGETLESFELALVGFCALGVLLVAVVGYRIARLGLQPLVALSTKAHALSPKNLGERLELSPLPAELADLSASFNGALDRLQCAYTQLEAFNADVAHELRTPLTNLVGQTQVALAKERSAAELEEVLQSNLEELERMRAIVNDMLFLARADQGETAFNRRTTSLREEIQKTVEFLELLIDEAGVSVRIAGDAQAAIETSLFHRATTNLLQNAMQHSPRGAEIVVEVAPAGEGARVLVANPLANPNDAIPEQHLPRLFDRFYRVDDSRRSDGTNHGLGLSIVKAVALMHGGGVFAECRGGTTSVGFTIGEAA